MAQRRCDHEQWARQQFREEQRQQRADLAAQKAAERERKLAAVEAGKARAEQLNQAAAATLVRLRSILQHGLDRPAALDLASLCRRDQLPPLDLGSRGEPMRPPAWEDYTPAEPGALSAMFGGRARYDRRVAEARAEFEQAKRQYDLDEAARQRWVRDQSARHRAAARNHLDEVEQHNRQISAMQAGLSTRDRESVEAYLERSRQARLRR